MRYFESLDDFYNECFKYNSIKELCDKYNMSFQGIMKIKTSGMLKIANHLQNSIQSVNKVD